MAECVSVASVDFAVGAITARANSASSHDSGGRGRHTASAVALSRLKLIAALGSYLLLQKFQATSLFDRSKQRHFTFQFQYSYMLYTYIYIYMHHQILILFHQAEHFVAASWKSLVQVELNQAQAQVPVCVG